MVGEPHPPTRPDALRPGTAPTKLCRKHLIGDGEYPSAGTAAPLKPASLLVSIVSLKLTLARRDTRLANNRGFGLYYFATLWLRPETQFADVVAAAHRPGDFLH